MADTGATANTAALLAAGGFPIFLRGFSAIDSYLGRNAGIGIDVLCGADVAELARIFEDLRYPGVDLADAALDCGEKTWYFHCGESEISVESADLFTKDDPSFKFLAFYQDYVNRRFYDPQGIYPMLRQISGKNFTSICKSDIDPFPAHKVWWEDHNPVVERRRALMDGAMIAAKYFPETGSREIREIAGLLCSLPEGPPPGIEEQRHLLSGLLGAANPGPGFELLKSGGFIAEFWPELAVLDNVDHAKEFHPEGNVWTHTLETLRYRKSGAHGTACAAGTDFDLRLSLGLLLHDVGKPLSESAGSRRFDGHAELGERQARRFLERLGFDSPLTRDVCYLVRNHMLPAALPHLPLIRTGEIMASPLFPALLELYRCDESSSFKGLDGYYESSAAYQSYLKHRRNPYRSADGKKY
ncbi:MAG: HD domain-containing protein [Treponema sp.]|jgi:poly(A) polymerase|nr:HD domain-containing protein [Treponema sp.]